MHQRTHLLPQSPDARALKRRLAGLSAQVPSLDCTYRCCPLVKIVLRDLLCKVIKSYIRQTRCIGQTRGRARKHACLADVLLARLRGRLRAAYLTLRMAKRMASMLAPPWTLDLLESDVKGERALSLGLRLTIVLTIPQT